jgi:thiosulfate/3-mercaptopyruvate sulfurtransferase
MRRLLLALTAAALSAGLAAPAWAEWSRLVSPAELQTLMADRDVAVIDIRSADGGADGKAPNYMAGHVPGSVSIPYGMWRGPGHSPGELLSAAQLGALLSEGGVEAGQPVVVIYEGPGQVEFGAAARVYWNLKSVGFEEIAILNGGLVKWREAGLPLETEPFEPEPTEIAVEWSDAWVVTRDEVVAVVEGEAETVLLDARAPAQWKGLAKHGSAKAPGTLPGAYNAPFPIWFDEDDPALMSESRTKDWAARAAEEIEGRQVISFCNTGQLAALNWFALSEIAGIENVVIYPESMVDWTHADLPVSYGQ